MQPTQERVISGAANALLLAALVLAPTSAAGQNGEPDIALPRAVAGLHDGTVEIDGNLTEEVWFSAPVLASFTQREPVEGQPSSERTEVRILYDQTALYIAVWLYDSDANGIVYGETRRDAELSTSDAVQIVLDTYNDKQNGFLFATTPAAIEYDGQITKEGQGGGPGNQRQQRGTGGGFNKNWDGSWDVATSRDANGWYAEFRIPFSTLKYGSGGEQVWGLNISRNIRRRNEEVFWAPIPRQFNIYRVSLAGELVDLQAPARRTLDVTPYVLGSGHRNYLLDTTTAAFDGRVGGDAKMGITPSLTLDLTVNTDFAQVEVDDQQINLTRFPLFFPEKRPFFLENAGTFAVGSSQNVELFFSRRVGISTLGAEVPITAGARLSGKVGGFTLGVMDIQTREARVFLADSNDFVQAAPHNNFAVVRGFREFQNRTRVGAIFVSRINTTNTSDYNLTYGVDGRLGIGEELTFDGYLAGTTTPGISSDQYSGAISGNYTSRDWTFAGEYRQVAENFNPEVGFVARPSSRFVQGRILRKFRFPEISWFRELRPHVSYREFYNLAWFSETRVIHVDSHFEFSNGAFFQLPALNFTREGLTDPFEISPGVVVPPGTYDNFEWGFAFNTDLSAPLSVESRIEIGGFYSGHRKGTTTTFNGRLSDTFVASVLVGYNDVDLQEGSFETSLLSLRAAYSFTPRIYLQALVQYNDQTANWSSNIRFGWLNTAGTGLFLVYNDIQHTGQFDRTGVTRGPVDRAFVVKFTKQFQLLR
jgi:hypothetical protein